MYASNAPSGDVLPSRYSSCAALPIAAASLRTPSGSVTKPAVGSSPTATTATFSDGPCLPRIISNASFALASGSSSDSAAATRCISLIARAVSSQHSRV